MNAEPQVAVTGVGMVSAAGGSCDEYRSSVAAGESGLRDVEWTGPHGPGRAIAGRVTAELPPDVSRGSALLLTAASEALSRADLDAGRGDEDGRIVGAVIGTCQGIPIGDGGEGRSRSPWTMHAATDDLMHALGFAGGPRATVSTACSAGTTAVAFGAELLIDGHADVVLVGGTDSLDPVTWAGFAALKAIDPAGCAPYTRSAGLSLGEGAGVLVLERLEDATARGATVLAELSGWGLSADAHHPTAPDPSGRGAALAMQRALDSAGIDPATVDHVNGHGTGTRPNDSMERRALQRVFSDGRGTVAVSGLKSFTGHALGGSGAIEAAATVIAITDGVVPPTLGDEATADGDGYDFVTGGARGADVRHALSNSYAFGGSNASIALSAPNADTARRHPAGDRTPVITGIGASGGLGADLGAWMTAFERGESAVAPLAFGDGAAMGAVGPPVEARGLAAANVARRIDAFSARALAVGRAAIADAGLELDDAARENVAMIVATGAGPLTTIKAFDESVRTGAVIKPMQFANAALCAAAGHVTTALQFRGPTSTVTSGGTSALLALEHASALIRRGRADVVLVIAAEELTPATLASAAHVPGLLSPSGIRPFDTRGDGTALGEAAVAFVVQAEQSRDRSTPAWCRLLGAGFSSAPERHAEPTGCPSAWVEAMARAAERSGREPQRRGYVAAAASGVAERDRAEGEAISTVAGANVPVGAPKSLAGECHGAAGAVGVLAAAVAVRHGVLAPTVGLESPVVALDHVVEPTRRECETAAVNAAAAGGSYASLVVGKG